MQRKQDSELQKIRVVVVVVVYTVIQNLGRRKQKDQESKAILGYKVYLNLTRATCKPCLKQKKSKRHRHRHVLGLGHPDPF